MMAESPAPAPSYHSLQSTRIHVPGGPIYTVLITISLILLLICALGMHFLIKCALRLSTSRRSRELDLQQESAAHALAKQEAFHRVELGLLPIAVYSNNNNNNKFPSPSSPAPQSSFRCVDSHCPICLSRFRDGQHIRVLPLCSHGFHLKCIDSWLSSHASCPTCRFDLTTLPSLAT